MRALLCLLLLVVLSACDASSPDTPDTPPPPPPPPTLTLTQQMEALIGCPVQALSPGRILVGTLDGGCLGSDVQAVPIDFLLGGGSTHNLDFYAFEIPAGRTVQITMNSTEFDTYLALYDSSGALIDRDDDGGPGLNSLISRTLSVGRYAVLASSYRRTTAGSYQILLDTP